MPPHFDKNIFDYMRVTFEVKYGIKELKMNNYNVHWSKTKELKMKNYKVHLGDWPEDLNFSFSIIDHGGF